MTSLRRILKKVPWAVLGTAVVFALAGSGALHAQAGTVRGIVSDGDTGDPVPSVSVLLRGTGLRVESGADGRFEMEGVPPGAYTLIAVHAAFRDVSRPVEVSAGGTLTVEVSLERFVFDVPGLVVTANRNETRPGDAPVSVAVLSSEEIAQRNVVDLSEALPFAQGVIFNSGQMDIRGATGLARGVGSRVLMLQDGHRALSGVGASINFDALPLLDVERVEIVKGPHSTLFGSNALGGVVNVITKRPSSTPETILQAYYGVFDTPSDLRFTDESLAMSGLKLQHSNQFGGVGTTVFVGREGTDGFRQNGRIDRWSARVKTVFPAESANPWEVFANFTRKDEEEFFTWLSADRPLEVDPTELGDWVREDNLSLGVTANPIASPDLRLQVRPSLYHARVQNHFHDNEDFHRSTRYGIDTQMSIYPNVDNAVTIGAEAAYTPVTSNFLGDESPRVTDLAAFAQDEIVLSERLRASVGLRLDYHKATRATRDIALSPKVGLVYQPDEKISLRGSVSRGYRAPSISEQFTATTVFGFTVIPNFGLKGETAWAGELAGTARVGERVWLDAGIFWSEYEDLIEPGAAPGQPFVFQFQNVAEARVRGVDAGLRVAVLPEDLAVGVTYVYLDSEDKRSGRALPYRSRHNLTTTLSGWTDRIAVDLRYRTRVDEVLAFPLDARTDVTVVDLRFGHEIFGWGVQAKVENLLQNSYVDVQERSPGATRSFRLTLTPRF